MATANTTQDPQAIEPQGLKAKIKKNPIISGIVAAVVLIAVIGIACYAYGNYKESRNQEAATKIAKGQNYFASRDFDQALNGDQSGYPGFVKIASQYSSTKTGNLANLYAGLSYYYKGDYKNAVKFLEEFTPQDDEIISNNAIAALGNCYLKIDANNPDKAIAKLKDAAKRADNPVVSPIYLIQAGLILENKNRKPEALELYKEVKAKYPRSGEARSIDKYIESASK